MNLRQEVSKILVGRGFRRKDRMHLLQVDKDFYYWVDTGPLEKRSDIAPFVGIRHDGVETLFAEFLGVPKDDSSGTVGANVGYVLQEGYLSWGPSSEPKEVLNKIDEALERYKPFISLGKLMGAWDVAAIADPNRPYREIVILVIQEDYEGALNRLEAARKIFCKEADEICEQFKGFEERVLNYMKSEIKDRKSEYLE